MKNLVKIDDCIKAQIEELKNKLTNKIVEEIAKSNDQIVTT